MVISPLSVLICAYLSSFIVVNDNISVSHINKSVLFSVELMPFDLRAASDAAEIMNVLKACGAL